MPLADLLIRIDALKAEWQGVQPLQPANEDRLWQKLRLEWNYNSNHIEGNTLTYKETFLLLVHGKTTGDHNAREIDEMRAHDVAIGLVRDWAQDPDRPLGEADVRDLNKLLLKEAFWKEARTPDGRETTTKIVPGQYKTDGNSVLQPDGTLFHYAKPEEVASRMADLMMWYASQEQRLHPLLLAAEWHHRFVLIHPFGDGNGRVARLVVNYILMRAGYMPLVVKSAEKSSYLTALKKADAGDMAALTEHLAVQEVWALELALRAAAGTELEELDDVDKQIALLKKKLTIQKGAKVKRTVPVYLELYEHSLRSLFREFIVAMGQFQDMFMSVNYQVSAPPFNQRDPAYVRNRMFDEVFEVLGAKHGDPATPEARQEAWTAVQSLNKLEMSIYFMGFKHDGVNTFNSSLALEVQFGEFTYTIQSNSDQATVLTRLYDEPLEELERKRILSTSKKQMLEQIEARLKQKR